MRRIAISTNRRPARRPRTTAWLRRVLPLPMGVLAVAAVLIACREPDACALSLVAFGDQGTGHCGQELVAEAVADVCAAEGCDAGLLLGDNFYSDGVTSVDDPKWKKRFVRYYGDLGFPFYAVLGNHDYGPSRADPAIAHVQVAYGEVNPQWIMPAEYYPFELGPALFLGMDTQRILLGIEPSEQATVFANALAGTTQPWKIAFGHHPYLSSGRYGSAGGEGATPSRAALRAFYEDTLCGNVDLFLGGHSHTLQVLDGPAECPGIFLVSGGGGREPIPLDEHLNADLIRFAKSTRGFAHLEIDVSRIRVRMYDEDGDLLYDEVVLN